MMPDNSVLPHMSLLLFELLSQNWNSEGGSQSKYMCEPFKRNCLDSSISPSHSSTIETGFYNQKLRGLTFLVLEPGLGGQVWDWDLLLPRYPSLFLSTAGEYETTCSASPCHSVSPCLSTSPKGPRMLIYYSTIIMKEGSCNIF